MAYKISDDCISCGACAAGCPVEAISEGDGKYVIDADTCISCGACRRACPTGCLRGEGESCLSAITQRKGELTEEEAEMMRKFNTVWGCDLCQSSCPHNIKPKVTPLRFFHEDRITRLTRERLDGMSKEEFNARAFAWRGRKTVERNLAILSEKNIEKAKTRD